MPLSVHRLLLQASVSLVDVRTGQSVMQLKGHTDNIRCAFVARLWRICARVCYRHWSPPLCGDVLLRKRHAHMYTCPPASRKAEPHVPSCSLFSEQSPLPPVPLPGAPLLAAVQGAATGCRWQASADGILRPHTPLLGPGAAALHADAGGAYRQRVGAGRHQQPADCVQRRAGRLYLPVRGQALPVCPCLCLCMQRSVRAGCRT